MPIYEYRCTKCDRSFEAFVRPGDGAVHCPDCNGSRLTREMSTFAARAGDGDGAAAAAAAMANSCAANGGGSAGGGCCGGGCGCH
jgi:putative FmdB family regulatory protein